MTAVLAGTAAATAWDETDLEVGPLALRGGATFDRVTQRVTRYGAPPRDDGSNVVLVPHGLTASSRVLEWWPGIAGPGALFDTASWHVVGVAALGGCYGSTGPTSAAPDGAPYGVRFPAIDVADQVAAQRRALLALGIRRIGVAIGASLGGMQALRWAVDHGDDLAHAVIVGAEDHVRALAIAFDAIGREALRLDPVRGLRLARMIATLTYKSDELFETRHGNRPDRSGDPQRFDIEGYLARQGDAFVERFDAQTYHVLTQTMDRFDARDAAVRPGATKLTFVGLGGDWLFPPARVAATARRWHAGGWDATYHDFASDYGHDAFLTEDVALASTLRSIGRLIGTSPADA